MTDEEALAWLQAGRRLREIEKRKRRDVAILERALKNACRARDVATQYADAVMAHVTGATVVPYLREHHLAGGPDATVERCSKRIAYEQDGDEGHWVDGSEP